MEIELFSPSYNLAALDRVRGLGGQEVGKEVSLLPTLVTAVNPKYPERNDRYFK